MQQHQLGRRTLLETWLGDGQKIQVLRDGFLDWGQHNTDEEEHHMENTWI